MRRREREHDDLVLVALRRRLSERLQRQLWWNPNAREPKRAARRASVPTGISTHDLSRPGSAASPDRRRGRGRPSHPARSYAPCGAVLLSRNLSRVMSSPAVLPGFSSRSSASRSGSQSLAANVCAVRRGIARPTRFSGRGRLPSRPSLLVVVPGRWAARCGSGKSRSKYRRASA